MAPTVAEVSARPVSQSDVLRALRDEICVARRELAAAVPAARHLTDARSLALSERVDRLVVAYMRRLQEPS